MLDVEDAAGVAVLRLRHGKVNALDLELARAIAAAMRDLEPAQAVVITGAGPAFSAGVDLRRIVDGGAEYVREFLPALADLFAAIFDHPGPALAAINGHAIAGGCVMAAACDVRLMSAGTIGLAELSVGVPFPPLALEIMRHAAGPALGRLVLTAQSLDAGTALSIGLVHALESPEDLLESALRQARAMARIPAEVFADSKRQIQRPARDRIEATAGAMAAVTATWESAATLDRIARYMERLAARS